MSQVWRVRQVACIVVVVLGLTACGALPGSSDDAPDQPTMSASSNASASDPPEPSASSSPAVSHGSNTLQVPKNLDGQTMRKAKARLKKIGFTNIVIAGGDVTDTDKVASVPKAGKKLPADAKIVVVGQPSQQSDNSQRNSGGSTSEQGRTPPKAGYQCQPGDENRYPVCAGNKKWMDDQYEWGCQKGYIKDQDLCARFQ